MTQFISSYPSLPPLALSSLSIGVDPGKDGGVTILWQGPPSPNQKPLWQVQTWQDFKQWGTWAKGLPELASHLRTVLGMGTYVYDPIMRGTIMATVEQVSSRPNEGHVGAFSFGMNYGSWLGLFAGLGIPVMTVPPDVWTAALSLTSDKTEHRRRAADEFPALAAFLRKKGNDGVADAALLALFGTRFLKPALPARIGGMWPCP